MKNTTRSTVTEALTVAIEENLTQARVKVAAGYTYSIEIKRVAAAPHALAPKNDRFA